MFHNFARYVVDLYQMPALGRDALMKRIDFTDWARLNEALDEGNGSLFVTLHLGQMDVGAAGMVASGHPVNVVAEPLGYEPMNQLIQDFRRRLGISVIPANKATSSVMRCLHRGEVLAMMFDGVDKGDCVPVQFFGETIQAPTAAARIALRTGSRILPAVLARDPKDPRRIMPVVDYGVRLEPTGDDEADVRRITQAMATAFEAFMRRFPDQWLAFHPVWGSAREALRTLPDGESGAEVEAMVAGRRDTSRHAAAAQRLLRAREGHGRPGLHVPQGRAMGRPRQHASRPGQERVAGRPAAAMDVRRFATWRATTPTSCACR